MAGKDEESLIGYDPLAWMHQADLNQVAQSAEFAALDEVSVEPVIAETSEIPPQAPVSVPELSPSGVAEKAVVVLEPVLRIQNVSALHQRLIQVLNEAEAIEIDASEVTTVDTATLQLLLILKQTAIGLQKSISIDFPSDKFVEAAELLGIAEMLEVDVAASGFF